MNIMSCGATGSFKGTCPSPDVPGIWRGCSPSLEDGRPLIIGIVGGKGAGKTTAAEYLASHYGAECYAIADELKELLRETLGLTSAQLYGSQAEKESNDPRWGVSPRRLMERQGDAIQRVYGPAFQVMRLVVTIKGEAPELAVVHDVRYKHEAKLLRAEGAVLWRLHPAPGLSSWPSDHKSEAEWRGCEVDLEIIPAVSGTLALHSAIDNACLLYGISRWV